MSDWLIDTFIATTIIMAAVLLLRGQVARLFGPGIAYGLWLLPAARLLMPAIEVDASQTADPATTTPVAGMISGSVRDAILAGVQEPAVAEIPATVSAVDFTVIGISLWLGGAALLFLVQMARYVTLRDELLAEAVNLGKVDGIPLLQSDHVTGPLAFGLFRRFIAVPRDFMAIYLPREREMALAHEVAHHRSGDLLVNLIAFIFLCLNWFNPVAWASWRAFRFDQEAACDARILAGADVEERREYGRALARSAQEGLPTFATALNSPKTIIARLRRLNMHNISNKRRLLGRVALIGSIALILPLTATAVPALSQDAPPPPEVAGVPPVADVPEAPEAPEAIPADAHKVLRIEIDKDGKKEVREVIFRGNDDADWAEFKQEMADFEKEMANFDREIAELDKEMVELDREMAKLGPAATDEARAEIRKAKQELQTEKYQLLSERTRLKGEKSAHRIRMVRRGKGGAGDEQNILFIGEDGKHQNVAFTPKDGSAFAWSDKDFAGAFVPEIEVSELKDGKCKAGEMVTSDFRGAQEGKNARIKMVFCGKKTADFARKEAINGLKEAIAEIRSDEDVPENIRQDIIKNLKEQINRLQNVKS